MPENWHVWPLRRGWVLRDTGTWALYTAFGLLIFIPALLFILPGVLASGVAQNWGGAVVLALGGAIALGSMVYVVLDLVRWARAGQYLIVMTPDDYVKQQPGKVTRVPMAAVADPTVKGLPDPGAVMTVCGDDGDARAATQSRGGVGAWRRADGGVVSHATAGALAGVSRQAHR